MTGTASTRSWALESPHWERRTKPARCALLWSVLQRVFLCHLCCQSAQAPSSTVTSDMTSLCSFSLSLCLSHSLLFATDCLSMWSLVSVKSRQSEPGCRMFPLPQPVTDGLSSQVKRALRSKWNANRGVALDKGFLLWGLWEGMWTSCGQPVFSMSYGPVARFCKSLYANTNCRKN